MSLYRASIERPQLDTWDNYYRTSTQELTLQATNERLDAIEEKLNQAVIILDKIEKDLNRND